MFLLNLVVLVVSIETHITSLMYYLLLLYTIYISLFISLLHKQIKNMR